ncbi:MAG TPA: hypothetical protein VFU47_14945 [Armatimonadota bacterium]|nr:hypothetical protein [Armatimonadota bacterium]
MTGDQRDSMSPEVRAEYEAIVTELVLERGWVVKPSPSEYGWQDGAFEEWSRDYTERRSHLARCRATATGPVREDATWSEFVGTFAPGGPNERRHGIEVDGATCACGKVKGRTVRLEGTVHDLGGAVFERLFRKLEARFQAEEESYRRGLRGSGRRAGDPLPGWPDPAARPSS